MFISNVHPHVTSSATGNGGPYHAESNQGWTGLEIQELRSSTFIMQKQRNSIKFNFTVRPNHTLNLKNTFIQCNYTITIFSDRNQVLPIKSLLPDEKSRLVLMLNDTAGPVWF